MIEKSLCCGRHCSIMTVPCIWWSVLGRLSKGLVLVGPNDS